MHRGRHYRVDGMRFLPTPVRAAGIPLWAATESLRGRAVRRAAGLDGIMPIGIEPADVRVLLDEVHRSMPRRDEGRPFDVVVAGTEGAAAWTGSGATWWLRVLPWDEPAAVSAEIIDRGPH